MSAVLDYGLKEAPSDVWDKDRWTVLTFLMLHSNVRNRCWPSMRRIAKQLGRSPAYVGSAKKWLLEHKAIDLVPYKMRLEDEQLLPRRQHVYQLTGKIFLDGKSFPYLYTTEDNGDTETRPAPTKNNVSPHETSGKANVSPHEISRHETFTPQHLTVSKNTSRPKNTTDLSKSLNRDFAKSVKNLPPHPRSRQAACTAYFKAWASYLPETNGKTC